MRIQRQFTYEACQWKEKGRQHRRDCWIYTHVYRLKEGEREGWMDRGEEERLDGATIDTVMCAETTSATPHSGGVEREHRGERISDGVRGWNDASA